MTDDTPLTPLVAAALRGECPRCQKRTLFAGWVRFSLRCPECDLDIDGFNVGDGPAAFLILIVGAIIVGLCLWVEIRFSPPWPVHIIWVPLTFGLTIGGLRLGKAALLHSEYRHEAREGRLQ